MCHGRLPLLQTPRFCTKCPLQLLKATRVSVSARNLQCKYCYSNRYIRPAHFPPPFPVLAAGVGPALPALSESESSAAAAAERAVVPPSASSESAGDATSRDQQWSFPAEGDDSDAESVSISVASSDSESDRRSFARPAKRQKC